MENSVPSLLIQTPKKQKYHIVGNHSAVKRCRWLHETLTNDRPCYKQKFYGIKTHQCMQMTPALYYCTQKCLFCWRTQNGDLRTSWDEMKLPTWDLPEKIVEESIKVHLKILTGYKGNPKTDQQKFREALTPRHVTISHTGEPTLYGYIGEQIQVFHRRGFTTFLVTNGTNPSIFGETETRTDSALHFRLRF